MYNFRKSQQKYQQSFPTFSSLLQLENLENGLQLLTFHQKVLINLNVSKQFNDFLLIFTIS